MSDRSKIEWTDASWNPIRARLVEKIGTKAKSAPGWHCEHVSEGCRNCYAEGINRRLGTGLDFKPGHYDAGNVEIYLDPEILNLPLRWKKPRRIFVGSMTDLFGRFVTDAMLDRVFAVMALASQHTFQVLTKRSARMRDYLNGGKFAPILDQSSLGRPDVDPLAAPGARIRIAHALQRMLPVKEWGSGNVAWPLSNVWLGVSCERQDEADERIPDLMATPVVVRFVSLEPLLGPMDISRHLSERLSCANCGDGQGGRCCDEPIRVREPSIDWVIVGGESGRNARPMHPEWVRALRDQCAVAGGAFFFKQWGEWLPGTQYTNDHRDLDPDLEGSRFRCMDWNGAAYERSGGAWCDDLDEHAVFRVGKARAGRLLDGVEHSQFPVSNPAPALLESTGAIADTHERSIPPVESEGGERAQVPSERSRRS